MSVNKIVVVVVYSKVQHSWTIFILQILFISQLLLFNIHEASGWLLFYRVGPIHYKQNQGSRNGVVTCCTIVIKTVQQENQLYASVTAMYKDFNVELIKPRVLAILFCRCHWRSFSGGYAKRRNDYCLGQNMQICHSLRCKKKNR